MGGRQRGGSNFDLDLTLFKRPDLVEKRCTAPELRLTGYSVPQKPARERCYSFQENIKEEREQ